MKKKTIEFYDNNAIELSTVYDNADMTNIYSIIEKYLKPHSKILDIGFGSGRDINYFQSKNYEVYGIDASKEFIKNFQNKYPSHKKVVSFSVLPNINIPTNLNKKYFDLIFSMATWMHLQKKDYSETINNLKKQLKRNGFFILGYSHSKRLDMDRYFEEINPQSIKFLFKKNGFNFVEEFSTKDTLDRNNMKWTIQVFKLK